MRCDGAVLPRQIPPTARLSRPRHGRGVARGVPHCVDDDLVFRYLVENEVWIGCYGDTANRRIDCTHANAWLPDDEVDDRPNACMNSPRALRRMLGHVFEDVFEDRRGPGACNAASSTMFGPDGVDFFVSGEFAARRSFLGFDDCLAFLRRQRNRRNVIGVRKLQYGARNFVLFARRQLAGSFDRSLQEFGHSLNIAIIAVRAKPYRRPLLYRRLVASSAHRPCYPLDEIHGTLR